MVRDTTIIISEFGSSIRKRGGRFIISGSDEIVKEVAASRTERIILPSRGASISTDAITLALEQDIPVYVSRHNGRAMAFLMSTTAGGASKIRRAQYSACSKIRSQLVKGFLLGKISNQQSLLQKKFNDYRRAGEIDGTHQTSVIRSLDQVMEQINALDVDDAFVNNAMVLEAHAASKYWTTLREMMPSRYRFLGRKTKGASDPINMLLNYGYGILRNEILSAVIYAGLDPFGGFLHADKPSRPSLVLDLMEEFRAPIVDSIVLRLTRQQKLPPRQIVDNGKLKPQARVQLIHSITECFSSPVKYQGKSVRMNAVIAKQAEQVSLVLRNQNRRYEPFLRRW